jgi:hypothetical protein
MPSKSPPNVGPTFFFFLSSCFSFPSSPRRICPAPDRTSPPRRLSPGLTLPHLPRPSDTSPWEATTLLPRCRRIRRSLVLPQLHYSGGVVTLTPAPGGLVVCGGGRGLQRRLVQVLAAAAQQAVGAQKATEVGRILAPLPPQARRGALPALAPAPTRARVQVVADVAQGFEYVHHHAGSVHSRVSPAAAIVSDLDLRARLVHFGAAELVAPAGRPGNPPPTCRWARASCRRTGASS